MNLKANMPLALKSDLQMTQAGSRDIGEDFQWIRCIITFFGA